MKEEWIAVAEVTDLPDARPYLVFPKGLSLILIKKDTDVYCVSNACAHMACPLVEGEVQEFALICPCHEWAYDIRNGEFLAAKEISIPTYDTKTEKGRVYVRLP
jgi:nitrite reductase/ring-hydroxylating ferredoxin subunit